MRVKRSFLNGQKKRFKFFPNTHKDSFIQNMFLHSVPDFYKQIHLKGILMKLVLCSMFEQIMYKLIKFKDSYEVNVYNLI